MLFSDIILDIINLNEFKESLRELSGYAANIKQERPIQYLLAMYLNRMGILPILEYQNYDIFIPEKQIKIEIKFFYEFDVKNKVKKFKDLVKDTNLLFQEIKTVKNSNNSDILNGILKDIFGRKPDMFILIIQSRNLKEFTDHRWKEKISCWKSVDSCAINKKAFKEYNEPKFFDNLEEFLVILNQFRPFSINKCEIEVKNIFLSTYHFFILEFNK